MIRRKRILLTLLVMGFYVLHQDSWNWDKAGLLFGFLPIGLAYHAGYSIAAACLMALLVRLAWPSHLTAPAESPPEESKTGEAQ
jgi:hypothetical protein